MSDVFERLQAEGLLALVPAYKEAGVPVSVWTAHRHRIHGVRGVVLESVRIGGRHFTSVAAVRRFIAAQQDPTPRSNRERKSKGRTSSWAKKQLAAEGLDS